MPILPQVRFPTAACKADSPELNFAVTVVLEVSGVLPGVTQNVRVRCTWRVPVGRA